MSSFSFRYFTGHVVVPLSLLNANVVANVEVINVGSDYTYANIAIQGNTGFGGVGY